jgi:mannose-6-phosphate isomerase-like protein (cupin superfamily)
LRKPCRGAWLTIEPVGSDRVVYREPVVIDLLAGRTLGTPDSSFVIGSWGADPPQAAGPPELIAPLHVHRADDEAWYVLSGKLVFQLDGDAVGVGTGGGILVPRGTAHTFWNPGPEPARYLIVMPPRVAALVAALHDPSESDAPAEIFRRFASELLS